MIVIAGGTGFLGRPLATALAADGHRVTVLTRKRPLGIASDSVAHVKWHPEDERGAWTKVIDGAEAVRSEERRVGKECRL